MKLTDLPGVGARIRERLIEQYGDEEAAVQAVLSADVVGLCRALSERQALLLVRHARGLKYSVTPEQFLATDEAERISQMLTESIAGHAHTEYARQKIRTLFASSSAGLLEEQRRIAESCCRAADRLQGSGIEEFLKSIRPLRERVCSRVRERAVAASSTEAFSRLKALGLDRKIDIHMAEGARELTELSRGYSHVCLVGDDIPGSGEVETAESLEDWYLVPEAVLGFYQENMETLLASARAAAILSEREIDGYYDRSKLLGISELEGLLDSLKEGGDPEARRLEKLSRGLSESVERARVWCNEELKKRIEKSSLTIGGGDILMVMSRGEGVRELLEARMSGVYSTVLREAKAKAAGELQLAGAEAAWLEEIFSAPVSYPLEINRDALRSFEQEIRGRMEERALKAKREIARSADGRRELGRELVHSMMEFDFAYAIGSFAIERDLTFPEICKESCLSFECGRHLFLEAAQPVSYALGDEAHPERVALLSGVNSGGKTTLLDLISQIVILAHMGLPVPARSCKISIFEEFYYFSKSRGTLSAGAFETAMRKFSVVENERRKLVLADELEAITEPGASARIIACMLDELNRRGCVAVFVSHLAEDVSRYTETPVRVDGIAAEGLDEENRLRVSRSPRYNYLAKSTPELILDRLVRTTEGREREFYARLLSRFK